MKAIATLIVVALVPIAFGAGAQFIAHRIQATCESDDTPTIINGTEYLCLSQRHMEMLRRQKQSYRQTQYQPKEQS